MTGIGFPAIPTPRDAGRDTQTAIANIRERMQALESAHTNVSNLQSGIANQQNVNNAAQFQNLQNQIDALKNQATPFTAIFGDGVSSTFVVVHNLGSQDVNAAVRRTSSPYDEILVGISRTSAVSVTVKFDFIPTINEFSIEVSL